MNKKVKICSAAMGIMCIFTNSMFFGLPGYQGALDRIKNTKVLDMSFDGNNNKNSVTNKNYASLSSTHKYISSEKGNGYEVNASKIKIPIKDLSLVADDKIVTVSFLFKWDGEDNIIPISIDGTKSKYSLWLNGTKFGFTTGNNDCYGFNHGFVKDKYYSIVAKFNFSDTSKSAIYVETLAKTLTLSGTKIDVGTISESGNVTLGGLSNSTVNDIKKKSAIDEVKIYKKDLSSDEVGAVSKAHMVPNLSSTRKDNNVTLEWTSEILTDNLIWSSGYELEEQPNINLLYDAKNGMGTGGQIFSNEAYTGSYSLMTPKTRPDKGNWKFYPYTVSTELNHVYYLGKTITFKNTDNISISYRIKADAAAKVRIMADWKFEKHFTSYGVTTTQKAVKGATVLHVSDPSKFKYDMRIAFDKDPNVIQEDLQRRVQSVDVEAKTIKLTSGIPYDLPANTELFFRDTRWAFDDSTKNIEASPEWQLINFNTGISKSNYIDWSEYAIPLRQSWSSDGNVYIDDLKVGYATRTKLYKNDIVVYDGYGNSYKDTGLTDTTAPNAVNNIKINGTNNSNKISLNIGFDAATDNGTDYRYNISAVDKNGVETPLSESIVHNVKSDIKGYSYVIDTNATTVPDNTVDTTGTSITKDLDLTNSTYYLHIKSIDNAGNVSNTVHTKIDIATLTATSLGSSNSIRLDWTIDDYANKVFDVYRKKAGVTAYSKSTSASGVNTYIDTGAKDLAKPNSPTVKSITSSSNAFSINLIKPDDNGTGYTFYINSKNSDGSIVTQSNVTSEVKVTSGIKGYSYVVDTNATTNPDTTVDSTSETISVSKTTSNNIYYLHVKAIDNAGNVSDTVHTKIDVATLTATSLGKDNGVKLTWTVDNTANKNFKIYQKQSDKSNFDYIATTTSSPYNNYEAKDLAAPDSPAVKLGESSSTQLKFNIYKPKDYGTAYDFYITSETIDGIVKTQSNIVSNIDVTSGIKGYSYILDEKETTIPGNTVNHTTEELTISNVTVGKIYYLHIKAIDNAGNGSKVTHLKINTSKPLAPELVLSREGWGKDDVSFEIKQQHTKNFSIASITRYTRKSYITKLKSLGYNITEKPNCTDVNELLAYDLVIYDADCGWVENNSVLKQLYDKGAKIITIGNDSSSSIYPILGAVNVDSSYDLTINRTVKSEATFSMPSYAGGRDSSSNLITSVVPEAKILYKQKIDGNPAIIEIENEFGGKWIHSQKILGLNDTENTDELSMGLIDYMMDSISQFHITDVQYSIDNGEWTSYNGGNIPVTKEGLHTISVRNVDNRGVYSEVVTKTVGIDRTAPYFTAVAPTTTELRSVTISLKGIGDSLSGVKDVRVSNYSDFRDSNGYTSVLGQTSFDLPVTIPFFEDLNLNYSVRTIYIELFDKAGNSKVIECTTKYEPKAPQIPVITSPESNKLYVTGEKVNVSWTYNDINNDGVSLPQSKAEITFANNTTGKIYSYTSNGTERDFSISSLNDGVYSVTVTVYNSFGKSSTSAPVKFRYNIFEPEGYVLSKTIALRYPMKYVNVISSVDIPKNTTVKGYIYYAVSPTDNFTDNKRVEFNINNRLTVKNTIILPEKASKIMIKWNLYSQDKNKNISPSIDDIKVYGR